MRKIVWKIIIAALAMPLAAPANAEVACPFSVSSLNIYADGWLYGVFQGSGFTKQWTICPVGGSITVNTGYNSALNVGPDACKAYYTQMIIAKTTGKQIALNFQGPANCSSAALPADGAVLASTLYPSAMILLN